MLTFAFYLNPSDYEWSWLPSEMYLRVIDVNGPFISL